MTETKEEKIEEKVEEIMEKEIVEPELKQEKKIGYRESYDTSSWKPKTKLGRQVKDGKITHLDSILDNHLKILEPEIVDYLIKTTSDLILIGQAKGKFGGGKRRAWKQTQKKTEEGNVATFAAMAAIGDENGHVGVGVGKAKERQADSCM